MVTTSDRLSVSRAFHDRDPLKSKARLFGDPRAFPKCMMDYIERTITLANELEALRVTLDLYCAQQLACAAIEPVCALLAIKPQVVSDPPAQQLTATWGS